MDHNGQQPKAKSQIARATGLLLATVIATEAVLIPYARANIACERFFEVSSSIESFDRDSLLASLPPEFRNAISSLKPKTIARLERRFQNRDRIGAEKEAAQIIAQLLRDDDSGFLRLERGLIKKSEREAAFRRAAHARLDRTDQEVRLENILLEIGYGEGSKLAQRWSNYRRRHARGLEMLRRTAINSVSNFLIAMPIELRRNQSTMFRPLKAHRRDWTNTEKRLREKVESLDPSIVKEFNQEILVGLFLRALAYLVLLFLLDEFLEWKFPAWREFKVEHFGPKFANRRYLEVRAYENWKSFMELVSGIMPDDNSPEAQEFKAQIKATPTGQLQEHVKNGAPLKPAPPSAPAASQVDETLLVPSSTP